jgi:hypothetical protein
MSATQENLCDAVVRLDKLEAQAAVIRLSLLKVSVYVAVEGDEIRQRAINACLAADVLSAPLQRFAREVHQVIDELLNDAAQRPGSAADAISSGSSEQPSRSYSSKTASATA